jgi:pyridoxal phosphate-dependent aminotransferase EpsN
MPRIYLSPPHLTGEERALLGEVLDSNWVAPVGPQLAAFERELAERVQVPHALALSSGTAALHLAMHLLGVGPGDEVLCATLTFAATANAVTYQGGTPVFIDCDEASWNLDPGLVREELAACAARGKLPRAVVSVDLYGQSADYEPLLAACAEYGVPLVEDAAEALGATYGERPVGGFGRFGVFSFNGNKIITTSGGGALVSHDEEAIARARYLSTQARQPAVHYEHTEVGYNYRLSNLLAAVGRAQLRALDDRVEARRRVFAAYRELLGDLPGLDWMPEAPYGRSNRWLTCLTLDPEQAGASPDEIRLALEAEEIEARPLWKPLHLQPAFAHCRVRGGEVAARLFARGLCLPSGSALERTDLERVAGIVRRTLEV